MPRIVTYNVHRCLGVDGRLDVGRVAAVLAALEPDIVGLQELDVGRARSGGVDQAHEIARRLDMACHFNAALKVEEEQYGDAILTSHPERLVRAGPLPSVPSRIPLEPRGAIWVAVDIEGAELQVLNTHLGLVPREQRRQAAALAGPDWLGALGRTSPAVLIGDFNATAGSVVYRTLAAKLRDGRRQAARWRTIATFPSAFPLLPIDHMFVSADVKVQAMHAPYDAATRVASDHLPLVMDFTL